MPDIFYVLLDECISLRNDEPMNKTQGSILDRLQFTIGDRLDKALRASGISNMKMAEYLGVNRNTVSNWINGRSPVSKQTLRLFALRTGVPYNWLTTGVLPDNGDDGDDTTGEVNMDKPKLATVTPIRPGLLAA